MKRILYFIYILTLISCNGQNKKENTINNSKVPAPIKHTAMVTQNNYKNLINDKIEYFDIKYFDKHKNADEDLIYTDKFGTEINIFGDSESGYVSNTTLKNSVFTVYKQFDSKGIISRKWVNFRNNGGAIGVKYEFDDSGKLIKEIDTDKNFKITPNDVIDYCKKNSIDLFSTYTYIDRFVDEKTKQGFYNINYRGKYEGEYGARIVILLNGNTGEIQKVVRINGKHNDSMDVLYEKK
ncbi:hypothetical protein [Chryseobacterium contaminans]|uniref:hypothetical protein n=1 Tax=Chryseobacterium contaminans TaxID=1423959 RepID=UPI0030199B4F